MDLNKVGKLISNRRLAKGMTQAQLGEILGVSDKTISKWECGRNAPDIAILTDLSTAIDVTLLELLSGEYSRTDLDVDVLQFYNKQEKRKFIKYGIITLLIIWVLFLTISITYTQNRFKVYNIIGISENYEVKGYSIIKNTRHLLSINRIEFFDENIGTLNAIRIQRLELIVLKDSNIIYRKNYLFEDETSLLEDALNNCSIVLEEKLPSKNKIFDNHNLNYTLQINILDDMGNILTEFISLNLQYDISGETLFT